MQVFQIGARISSGTLLGAVHVLDHRSRAGEIKITGRLGDMQATRTRVQRWYGRISTRGQRILVVMDNGSTWEPALWHSNAPS
jgi:hypothetical protein